MAPLARQRGPDLPSKCYVFNEWLLNELLGDNGPKAQNEAYRILVRLRDSCDRIAMARQTKWADKAYSLMKHTDPVLRSFSKYLHLNILRDNLKCLWLLQGDLRALPESEKGIPEEDVYLVQVYHAAEADMIVTTDTDLLAEAEKLGIPIVHRDEFIREYLGGT